MPFIRFTILEHCVFLTIYIFLNREIISLYSCCIKKRLEYIAITAPFSY